MMDIQKQVAFEKFHARDCNCDYEDLKRSLDRHEILTGHRYPPASPRHEAWLTWCAAWDAKAQAVPEWISVEDGLPSDGQNIIAFDEIKHCVFKDGEFLQGYFDPDTGHEYTEPVDVTHWIAIEAQEPTND